MTTNTKVLDWLAVAVPFTLRGVLYASAIVGMLHIWFGVSFT